MEFIYFFNNQNIYKLSYNLNRLAQAKFPDVCEDKYNFSCTNPF